jgi:hypothetical protein
VENTGNEGTAGNTSTEIPTSGSSGVLPLNTNALKPTGEFPEKADIRANQELHPWVTYILDDLILHLQTEDEGPLDYFAIDITLYSNPVVHTTMRALTLEEKFGIKLLCPGPNFHKTHQLASVFFMPQHTLRENMAMTDKDLSADLWNYLIEKEPEVAKYDQLAFKYYSPEILYDAYSIAEDYHYDSDFSDFSSFRHYVYRCYYLKEWKTLRAIQKYNNTAGQTVIIQKPSRFQKPFSGDTS